MKATIQNLKQDVTRLTSVQPPRNYANLASLNEVADYLHEEFAKLNCQVRFQDFKAAGKLYKNVCALFKGKNRERIVVGAHYDVCGDQPGADDNASGVAGLLETARLLSAANQELAYDIEFVAYCLEEPPFFGSAEMGSAVHAASLQQEGVKVKVMICYEMIGYFSDAPGSQKFPEEAMRQHYPDTGNFIVVVGQLGHEQLTTRIKNLMQPNAEIEIYTVNLPAGFGLVGLSDHRNYWSLGIDAVMINDSSFLRNPHYHLPSDTPETLDFRRMAEVVNGVAAALQKF